MKLYRVVPVAVLLFVFTFTNVAQAYSAPSLATLTAQLQGLLLQLNALLGGSHELTAATTVTPVPTPRTCQITLHTRINGNDVLATTTMSGAATDEFAIALTIGTSSTKALPYGKMVQMQTWGKSSTTASVGYFTPEQYTGAKANLASYLRDPHYKLITVALANIYNVNSTTTYSEANPYAEGVISNDAIGTDIPADKAVVRVNVSGCTPAVQVQNPNKPNILFVLADDLDMQTMAQLPKLKSLMTDKGMTFENHYTSLSLCCPARTATLCGEYAHNNGVLTNQSDNHDGTLGGYASFMQHGDDSKTMALQLQNAGYRTALMGKFLNGYDLAAHVSTDVPKGWNEWSVPMAGSPYTQYNYTLNANGKLEKYHLPELVTQESKEQNFMMNVLNTKAKDFITKNAKDSTPFFLYLAPFAPHYPATPAPHDEHYLTDPVWLASHTHPLTASFNEVDISDKPAWLKNNAGLLSDKQISGLQNTYRKRIVSMYAMQDMLEDLIKTLKANGQLDNTYIVFMSDNGYHLGEHRLLGGKLTEFDTDLHIPLIIRGPKVAAGSKTSQLTANVDIAPTFEALANIPIPSSVDGRSFKETLLGGTSIPRNALLIEHGKPVLVKTTIASSTAPNGKATVYVRASDDLQTNEVDDNPSIEATEYVGEYRGIRTPKYTYVHYTENNEEELYDNVNDPDQLNNVASVAGSDLMTSLRNWTNDLAVCKGESCRKIEAESRVPKAASNVCFAGGSMIPEGKTVTMYSTAIPGKGGTCSQVAQTRTCTNGVLSGTSKFTNLQCSEDLVNTTGDLLSQKGEDTSIITLGDNSLLMMRAGYASTSTGTRGRLWTLRSTDNGATWNMLSASAAITYAPPEVIGEYGINGPMMQQLSGSTTIMATYHLWKKGPKGTSIHSIETAISTDRGVTWTKKAKAVEVINLHPDIEEYGLWEPAIVTPKLRPGVIQIYYARERSQAEACPQELAHATEKGQDIMVVESNDNSTTWGTPKIAIQRGKAREGVPAVAETVDGALYMAHEHVPTSGCAEVGSLRNDIGMAASIDGGITWNDNGSIYDSGSTTQAYGWPHMIRLLDGRLAVRYSSNYSVYLLLTKNVPSRTVAPIWQATPSLIMTTDQRWGTLVQLVTSDLIVTGGQTGGLQNYRIFKVPK